MPQDILQVHQLSRSYRDGQAVHPVLEQVDLTLRRGECVALVGRSGSGKSTLLNLVAGIDRADTGTVMVNGQQLTGMREPALTRLRSREIGFVYQFFNLIPTLTAAENIALPLELNAVAAADSEHRVAEMLERIGLQSRQAAFPDQLSGGEQQRVAVARALIHRPSLLLADEPTGNLDQHSAEQVLQLLFGLARQQQAGLLLVTHSRAVAERADRVVSLVDGCLTCTDAESVW
jgi:putative ABC transport system ATP-binding protein